MIKRFFYNVVLERLKQFPAVALLGPRQVGKTTLAEEIATKIPSVYLDLESVQDRAKLEDPISYLSSNEDKLVILDEVHRVPQLFQTLRGLIDKGKRKGYNKSRFLLLGSASLDLLKQSGESLAGRIAYIDLPAINAVEVKPDKIRQLWIRGGFPDSFLAKDDSTSLIWRNNFIRTYLERDIPELGPRIAAETLQRFWTMLAHSQGATLQAAQLARSLAVDGKTIASYLDLMVDLLLVRRLRPYYINIGKRLVKAPKVYVRDSGITHALLGIQDYDKLAGHPIIGASWEGFVIENIISLLPLHVIPNFYRTASGAEVDLVLEFPGKEIWIIEIKNSLQPCLSKGFYSAKDDIKPQRSFVVYGGMEYYKIAQDIEVISLIDLLKEIVKRG